MIINFNRDCKVAYQIHSEISEADVFYENNCVNIVFKTVAILFWHRLLTARTRYGHIVKVFIDV